MFKEFKEFILRGNVVELAVAVIIAIEFSKVVEAMVELLTNLVAIPGSTDFSSLKFKVGGGTFRYGNFINAVVGFLIVAAVVFFLIVRPLNKLAERRRVGAEPEPAARPDDVLLLEEIRDLLKAQQGERAPLRATRAPRPAPE